MVCKGIDKQAGGAIARAIDEAQGVRLAIEQVAATLDGGLEFMPDHGVAIS